MNILEIETSCEETAIAVLSISGSANPKCQVKGHEVASQIALHEKYGGVFPMMAKREHAKNIVPIFLACLAKSKLLIPTSAKSPKELPEKIQKKLTTMLEREKEMLEIFLREIPKIKKPKIDKIVVTVGPGLAPALWVGINFAKALAVVWDLPIVPVNHMEGHVLSVLAPTKEGEAFSLSNKNMSLSAISLLVSGGHTEIVLVKDIGKYKILGQTRDDAAGEAFDKVARMLGMTYPGGPHISRLADQARKTKLESTIKLPRPMMTSPDFDFSFSGLKTAVLYLIRDLGGLTDELRLAIAREFEDAVVDVLVHKTLKAATKHKAKSIIVGGGVSANRELARRLTDEAKKIGISVTFPAKNLSTDNAIMIGIAGYFGKKVPLTSKKLLALGNMSF